MNNNTYKCLLNVMNLQKVTKEYCKSTLSGIK